jgi:hypothetical protein
LMLSVTPGRPLGIVTPGRPLAINYYQNITYI